MWVHLLACFNGVGAKLVIMLLHLLEKSPDQDMLVLNNSILSSNTIKDDEYIICCFHYLT
jgi:hypothetical protein